MTRSTHTLEISDNSNAAPELLAPAGDWECARAAVQNGADAIYFGLSGFNARMRANNFTVESLPELMDYLHQRGVRGYVTMNTLVFANEVQAAASQIRAMIDADVDAVIVQDMGLCRMIRSISPDFPIHASTQMTITSPAGIRFAKDLGCELVVMARECSMKELESIRNAQESGDGFEMPLEVFVHGALCVAYSGQCLTSEALGGRSANRGECAQACRMPYELIQDGNPVPLGDRQYLLSPQDLAGISVLPDLVRLGMRSLKIEGRLKAPEYVANVTRVYRQAIDSIIQQQATQAVSGKQLLNQSQYDLEMAFSRGLHTGWFEGIDNQKLVHARFGKKRGVYLGKIKSVHQDGFTLSTRQPLKAGDGVVIDQGNPNEPEQGGRLFKVSQQEQHASQPPLLRVSFQRNKLDLRKVNVGDRIWKTSDPALDKDLRKSYQNDTRASGSLLHIRASGQPGSPLKIEVKESSGRSVNLQSSIDLQPAQNRPLSEEVLSKQWSRLGGTSYQLESVDYKADEPCMLPVSELNRMRREMVTMLDQCPSTKESRWTITTESLPEVRFENHSESSSQTEPAQLIPLVRNMDQLEAAIQFGSSNIYCEFEDPKKYRDAVKRFRAAYPAKTSHPLTGIWVAPPRITKPGEEWILKQVQSCEPDGFLVRNYDHLEYYADARCIADFSFNVSNAWSAAWLLNQFKLERLTASYDLNIEQLKAFLASVPTDRIEITLHQHMPMFHMEHCVFCAFLSTGKDYRDCGRPCEKHHVELRDRVGQRHTLKADAGCRNTVFNGRAQTGAEYATLMQEMGVRHFRVEFISEKAGEVTLTLQTYQDLLQGKRDGASVWRDLKLINQLGVTRGTLETQGIQVS
ncbi:MAG: DUF3656 domain-containing protein [Verrucomicrobiota bacterium]